MYLRLYTNIMIGDRELRCITFLADGCGLEKIKIAKLCAGGCRYSQVAQAYMYMYS